jgi:hypothetical protein
MGRRGERFSPYFTGTGNSRRGESVMGKADLHIHTSHSDGMFSADEMLAHVEDQTDLDVVAVTDHDDLRGAWNAREKWASGRHRFEVVAGMEITTIEGHLLPFIETLPDPPPGGDRRGGRRQSGSADPHPSCNLGMGERHMRRVMGTPRDKTRGTR